MLLRRRLRLLPAASVLTLVLVLAACGASPVHPYNGSSTTASASMSSNAVLPPIRHVFVIMLENEGYASSFGNPANDPYLASTLVKKGALLENYYGVGHFSLDNYIAFVSGQPPNASTEADCVSGPKDFPPSSGQVAWKGATGIQQGDGCVYPAAVQNIGNQLTTKGLTWKGYMEDMGNNPVRDGAPDSVCGHPPVNGSDPTVVASPGDGYAVRHDPFVYFHSIIDDATYCDSHVVPLGTKKGVMPSSDTIGVRGLVTDLASIDTTPNFSWITPNLCNDGHNYPCLSEKSPAASPIADVDLFLQTWVPIILNSPAFKKDGLLEITFDESNGTDDSACCNQQPGPSGTGTAQSATRGGGRIGALLISPFIKPGITVKTAFNHYSSLASIEEIFGLARLGNAQTVSSTFDGAVFNAGG